MSDKDKKPPTAQEISSACDSNKHNKQGKVGSAETSSCGLVTLKAYYEDRWKTPMAGATFDLYVNGKKVLSKARLAGYDHPEWKPGTFVYEVPEQGKVNFVITSEFTEAEIKNLKASIRQALAPQMTTLIQSMKPYQEDWAKNPTLSFLSSLKKGADQAAGGVVDSTLESLDDLFSEETWESIKSGVANLAEKARSEAEEQAKELSIAASKVFRDIDKNGLGDWATETIIREAKKHQKRNLKNIEDLDKAFEEAKVDLKEFGKDLKEFGKDSAVIFKHREQVLNLPNMILEGDVDAVESFLDTVVKQVDPKIYAEIKDSEQWQSTIELIYDGEAIGLPLYYLSEMMSAIPPNFYAEKLSYIGATIVIEVALIVVLALLGGAGAAVRLATLIARINNIASKSKKGASALKAYIAMLKAFEKAIDKIKKTADKLTASRRGKGKTGATAGTITSTRKDKKKPKKCNTKNHKKIKKGTIEYI